MHASTQITLCTDAGGGRALLSTGELYPAVPVYSLQSSSAENLSFRWMIK